jgi:hypothetical protein
MRYEIDENDGFAIRIWHENTDAPAIFQPTWPDGTAWASLEEAETWAQLKMGEFDPNWTIAAGLSPAQPSMVRPTKEEEIERALSYFGISVNDLKQVLGL